jgi:hypothetical protein
MGTNWEQKKNLQYPNKQTSTPLLNQSRKDKALFVLVCLFIHSSPLDAKEFIYVPKMCLSPHFGPL